MQLRLSRIAFFMVSLPLFFAACYDASGSSKNIGKYTLEDKKEAKVIAFCLAATITPPDDLYGRVLRDLAEIRSSYAQEFVQTPYADETYGRLKLIRFLAPWVPSCVIVRFEPAIARLIEKGQYRGWDDLNELYHVSKIDLTLIDFLDSVVLSFKGQFHSRRLSELYAALPGARYAHPNYYIGDYSMIYPSKYGASGMSYLFKYGWGDCPSGCIYGEYWYFISVGAGGTALVGHWNMQKSRKAPDWWYEAKRNIELYRTF